MNNYTKEKFHETVGVLAEAYLKGKLLSGWCEACAVGNLVAHHNGYEVCVYNDRATWIKGERTVTASWGNVFHTQDDGKQVVKLHNFEGTARREILSTGYTMHDFGIIETAFEKGYNGGWFVKDRQFRGLMYVVDVLCEIHGMNTEEKKGAKLLFQRA